MKKFMLCCVVAGILIVPHAHGVTMSYLGEFAFHVGGDVYNPWFGAPLPADLVDLSASDPDSGQGEVVIAVEDPGVHRVGAFVDLDIAAGAGGNGGLNEYAWVSGVPDTRLTWEVDEAGYRFGDIYDHFLAGGLDNHNAIPKDAADDPSIAMMWDFSLRPGETATISFLVSATPPEDGFFIAQTDPDEPAEGATYFMSSWLRLEGVPVPDNGATAVLLGLGLGLCKRLKRRLTTA